MPGEVAPTRGASMLRKWHNSIWLSNSRPAMKLQRFPLALALALAIGGLASGCAQDSQPTADASAVTATPADAHDTEHADAAAHAAGADYAVPAGHEPWIPDAPLVEGMSRVRTAIADLQAHPESATVVARATDIDAAIQYMFANCKLEPEPDNALHAVLARLIVGTQALHANPADLAPVTDMQAAVANYEQLFDDPNRNPRA